MKFQIRLLQMVFSCTILLKLSTEVAQAYYNPQTGRWLSRDPIGERGAENLYAFVDNDSVRFCDALGNIRVIYPRGAQDRDVHVEITARLTASDVCHGGPLKFNVHFTADYAELGTGDPRGWAWFRYGGTSVTPENGHMVILHDQYGDIDGIAWDANFRQALPDCPSGRQSGSLEFTAGEGGDPELSIIFGWRYMCDCSCNVLEPFRPSYTYQIYPPLVPAPPEKPQPGKPFPSADW